MDSTESTSASSDERSKALDLRNEFNRKITQAKGICDLICHVEDIDKLMADSVWAASDLIEEGKKAADELWQLYRDRAWPEAPKAGQS